MSKKTILVLLGFAFLLNFRLACAGVIINEVMYAPASGDSEWIEIFNSGSESIDLSDWRFFNNETDSAPLRLQKGSAILPGGGNGYAIITTTSDWNSFSGTVFSSSQFSLPNDSSKYNTYKAIADSNKQIINSITYTTSTDTSNTGNSLSLIKGEWKSATKTPNAQNYNSVEILPASNNNSGSSGSNSSTQSTTQTKIVEIPKIKTEITTKTLAFVGIPIEFSASTTGHSNELLNYGKYFWNFGDGDSKETKVSDTAKFTHTFFYEGEYTIALEYYQNYYSESPDASDEITIKIIPANVSISNVGDEKDFFVEISNDTDYDADISKWILSSSQKSFTLPRNMILESKKKIILSPKITGFSILDKDTLKLLNSQWGTVFDYSASLKPVEVLAKKSVKVSTAISTAVKPPNGGFTAESANEQIPSDNLEATAVKSDTNTGTGNNLMYGIGLFAFLGLSTSAAYFVRARNRKIIPGVPGGDFNIIDE
ncbi:MAG: lamin tail domain-containing protein [Candidatus Nomurabacteria bacterium]|nr:lamin tail domain-containing protein [Candidatus Nomurabacteria bacterium]